ncbi:MAG: hypothetical protein AAGJ46_05200 [Planctomycetota bacterium]
MRRRKPSDTESLDLLLDAISNTFGGVLFIAVLVVILLQFTGEARTPSPTDPRSAQQLQEESQRLQQEIAKATDEARRLGDPEEVSLIPELSRLQQERAALAGALDDAAKAGEKARDRDTERVVWETQRARLETRLRRLLATAQSKAALPRQRETSKQGFPLLLTGGRLVAVYEADRDDVIGPPRLNDFVDVDPKATPGGWVAIPQAGGVVRTMRPKPGAGEPLRSAEQAKTALQRVVRGTTPRTAYLAIAAWEDSFAQFSLLRKAIVDLGYEYRLIPLEASESMGSAPKTGAPVVQ